MAKENTELDELAVGDWVRISPHGQWDYEVAEIKMYPHGPMIGIYDEPPSKHVDFWNPSSLTLARKPNDKDQTPNEIAK